MKISILLPYKENYSPDYAGAVSIFINAVSKLSRYKKNIRIFGNTDLKQRFSKNRCFSKDGPREPQITSKSEENCPKMLQKTPKRQTNIALGGGPKTY